MFKSLLGDSGIINHHFPTSFHAVTLQGPANLTTKTNREAVLHSEYILGSYVDLPQMSSSAIYFGIWRGIL